MTNSEFNLSEITYKEPNYQAFDLMLEGVQILGFDWRYIYLNAAAEMQNRRSNTELQGQHYVDMWPGIESTKVYSVIKRCLEQRVATQMDNRFIFPDGSAGWFNLRIQPVPEGVLILSFDVTERVSADKSLAQTRRLYATLSKINHAITRIKNPSELYQSICDAAVNVGGFNLSWVGLLEETTGEVRPVEAYGMDLSQWPFPDVNINEGIHQNGLVADAFHSGKVITSENIRSDHATQPNSNQFEPFNLNSAAFVPFGVNNKVIGILGLLYSETGFFKDQEEIRLLEELGMDISFALDKIETERIKRQWADAFENCAIGIAIGLPTTGQILTCNSAYARLLGRTVEEISGMSVSSFYASEDRERVSQAKVEADRTGSTSYEARMVRKDGTVYPVQVDVISVRDESGNILYRVVTQQDITERKRAEEGLQASEARYRFISENVADVIWMMDPVSGKFTYVSPSVEKLRGYSPTEVMAQPASESLTPESAKLVAESLALNLPAFIGRGTGTQSYVNQIDQPCKDGAIVQTEVTTTYLFNPQGQVEIVGVSRDITERIKAEAEVRASQAKLQTALASITNAVFISDINGTLIDFNEAFATFHKFKDKNECARTVAEYPEFLELYTDDGEFAPMENWPISKALHGETATNAEYFLRRKDTGEVWVGSYSFAPLRDKNGSIVGAVVVGRDVTSRKREEETLRKSEALLSEAQRIGHIGHMEWTAPGTDMICSDELYRILEIPSGTGPIDRNVLRNMIPPEDRERLRILDMAAFANHTDVDYEFRVTLPSGQQHWIHQNANLTYGEDGRPVRLIGVLQDVTERKRAEENLRKNERVLRLFVEHSPAAIAMFDNQMRYMVFSQRYLLDYRLGSQDLTGRSHYEVFPEIPNRWREIHQHCLQGAIEKAEKDPFPRSDGTLDWVRWEIHPWFDEDGKIGGIILFSEVITESINAQEILQKREIRFRSLIENAPGAITLLGMDGTLKFVSSSIKHVLGYDPEDMLGKNPAEMTHPEDLPGLLEKLADLMQNPGKVCTTQYRVKAKNGDWRWVESTISNLLDVSGVNAITFNYQDITERKRAEEELQFRNILLTTQLKASIDGILVVDENGKILTFNQRFVEMWHLPAKLVEAGEDGPVLEFVMHQMEDPEPFIQRIKSLYENKQETSQEEIFLADGRVFERYTSPMYGSEPHYFGRIWYFHDISERKAAEQKIQHRTEDLLLINILNEAVNRGEDIEGINKVFIEETQKTFGCQGAAIYLLSADGHFIEMVSSILPKNMAERVERVIGRPIPKIRVPIRENSFFKNVLSNEQGTITNDPILIQQWMKEFTETSALPSVFRAPIKKIVPQIFKTLKIRSTITIPLISSHRTIGLLDMSSNGQFNEEDLTRIRNISHQVTAIILRKQAEDQVKTQLERIRALNDIDHAINSSLDMRVSLEILLKEVLSQLHVDAAAILLLNEPGQILEYVTGKGFRTKAIRQTRLHLGEGLGGQVGYERKILHITDVESARPRTSRVDMLKSEDFVEYIGVPLIAKGTLKGVLEIYHRSQLDPDLDWMNFLETLSGQASIAIDNVQLFEGIQQSNQELIAAYDATITGWSQAMDLRDKETEGHTQRVTDLTLKLAKRMGIGQAEMVQIRRGALLHDIGKLGVPDQILLKPGPLTDEEWIDMRQHPNFAFNMLMPIAYLRSSLDIPYCHHEKWDGSGYPRGLKGEDIPMAARLFAIIDVWDALRSNRPYRTSWTAEKTRQYILDQSGKQFDPVVVRYFLEMLRDGEVS